MSSNNRTREIDDALMTLADRAGAHIAFDMGGVHRRVTYTLNGRSRFDVLTGTPRDSHTIRKVLAQAKRTLRSLGAAL